MDLTRTEGSISELKDRTIEVIQTKILKQKRNEKIYIINMWANTISNQCIIGVPEERSERTKQKKY